MILTITKKNAFKTKGIFFRNLEYLSDIKIVRKGSVSYYLINSSILLCFLKKILIILYIMYFNLNLKKKKWFKFWSKGL